MKRPVERKVYGATIGAGAGSIISGFVLWGMDSIWWPSEAANVPGPVAAFTEFLIITGLAFASGWLAKHDPGVTSDGPVIVPDDPAANYTSMMDNSQ